MDSINQGLGSSFFSEEHLLTADSANAQTAKPAQAEVMHSIVADMPIGCIAKLTLADQAAWQDDIASDDLQRQTEAANAITVAAQHDCNIDDTRSTLLAIEKAPLMSQPQLLRALAEKVPGLAKIGPEQNLPEWDHMVARIETALRQAFPPEGRDPLLRDLYIADLYAKFLPFLSGKQVAVEEALSRYLDAFSSKMLGDFMAVANALNIDRPMGNWVRLLKKGSPLSRPASDNFARAMGLHLLENSQIDNPVGCLEHFGITKTQIEQSVIPSLARSLSRSFSARPAAVIADCRRWGSYSETLAAAVDASLFSAQITAVRNNELAIQIRHNDEPQPLNQSSIAFVKKLECDTLQALGNDPINIDRFLTHWQLASKPVYRPTEWIKKFEILTAETIPLLCQPALLDRWALGFVRLLESENDVSAQAASVYARLQAAITHPELQKQPKLLGRMYVALAHALTLGATEKPGELNPAQTEVVDALFQNVPPSGWAWMLELTIAYAGKTRQPEQLPRFAAFIGDPDSSASVPTPSFCVYVIAAAATMWERLPDKADDEKSKLDGFCDRFGITPEARPAAKENILNGIVARAISGEFTLSDGLALGGFDADPDARRYTHHAFRYHSNAGAAPATTIIEVDAANLYPA